MRVISSGRSGADQGWRWCWAVRTRRMQQVHLAAEAEAEGGVEERGGQRERRSRPGHRAVGAEGSTEQPDEREAEADAPGRTAAAGRPRARPAAPSRGRTKRRNSQAYGVRCDAADAPSANTTACSGEQPRAAGEQRSAARTTVVRPRRTADREGRRAWTMDGHGRLLTRAGMPSARVRARAARGAGWTRVRRWGHRVRGIRHRQVAMRHRSTARRLVSTCPGMTAQGRRRPRLTVSRDRPDRWDAPSHGTASPRAATTSARRGTPTARRTTRPAGVERRAPSGYGRRPGAGRGPGATRRRLDVRDALDHAGDLGRARAGSAGRAGRTPSRTGRASPARRAAAPRSAASPAGARRCVGLPRPPARDSTPRILPSVSRR